MKNVIVALAITCFLSFIVASFDANAKRKSGNGKARQMAKKECLQKMPQLSGKSLQKCIKDTINSK